MEFAGVWFGTMDWPSHARVKTRNSTRAVKYIILEEVGMWLADVFGHQNKGRDMAGSIYVWGNNGGQSLFLNTRASYISHAHYYNQH
jgi:hypothetical protein